MPAHEATTAQLGALYPGMVGAASSLNEVFIGTQASGELFCFDPFELYRAGVITNPNIAVFGQIGRGKSSLVKTFLFRQAAFGRRIVVLDPKGEYGALGRALGCEPLVLRPGGDVRVNPLAVDLTLGSLEDQRRGCLSNATVVATAVLGRELTPGEHLALEFGLDQTLRCTQPALGLLTAALLEPEVERAAGVGMTVEELRGEGRALAFELRRFTTGELSGMFDGGIGADFDLQAAAVVIDLSAIYRSAALSPAIACIQLAVEERLRGSTRQTVMVVDEAWAVLANVGAARFFQSSFKLARAFGVANVVVAHRVSDLHSTGSSGSVVAQIAQGLLADCETTICYAQSEQEISSCSVALGLTGVERALLPSLRRGTALWHVGQNRYLVEHRLSRFERELIDTDQAMNTRH